MTIVEFFNYRKDKEDVYFFNDLEEIALRVDKDGMYFAKIKGSEEYEIKPSTTVVMDAIADFKKISKDEYLAW